MRFCGAGSPLDTNCVADWCAHEYDPSSQVSQKRRKTRMSKAMIDRYKSTGETSARLMFRLPKVSDGNRKHPK